MDQTTLTPKQRDTVLNGMQLLFIFAVTAIFVSLLRSPFLNVIVGAVEVVGIYLLQTATKRRKYLLSTVTGAVSIVLTTLFSHFTRDVNITLTDPLLVVQILVSIPSLISRVCLFSATADLMAAEGIPEEADSGRFAAKLTLAFNLLIIILVPVAALFVSSGLGSIPTAAFLGLAGTLLIGLVAAVMSIALLVIRLTYFRRCRAKLLAVAPREDDTNE